VEFYRELIASRSQAGDEQGRGEAWMSLVPAAAREPLADRLASDARAAAQGVVYIAKGARSSDEALEAFTEALVRSLHLPIGGGD
jgi:hypothetical protein